jgi:serine/threonine-protein kinase
MPAVCSRCGKILATGTEWCPVDRAWCFAATDGDLAPIGTTIEDRFHVERLLGVGATGAVYEARQLSVGRPIAVKVLRAEACNDDKAMRRFLREAHVISVLANPHVVGLHDFGRTREGRLWIAMELLHGRPLNHLLGDRWVSNPSRAVRVATQVLDALVEAHGMGILHRDLKPENVFLLDVGGAQDFVKVLDFGLAKFQGTGPDLTGNNIICGTLEYMSPEQCRAEELDGRSDIYQVGVVLFEMLAGRLPFEGKTAVDAARRKLIDKAPAVSTVNPGALVPASLEAAVARLLAMKPKERPSTAGEAKQLLEAAMAAGDRPWKPPVSSPTRPDRPLRDRDRRWWPWVLLGGGVAALAATIAWLLTR